jgi:hypothetical protein
MNSSNANGVKKPAPWLMINSSSQVKAALILALTILYVITFEPITKKHGVITAPLVAFPVVLAGWFFGSKAGFFASLMSIILNAVLYIITLANGWDLWVGTSWPGNLMTVVVGVVAGILHESINRSERADAESQKRLRESDALAKISRALSETEHVGLSTVLQLIVNSAKE